MEKREVLELLKTYRNLPALWDMKSSEYSNRIAKETQYGELLAKFRESNPTAEKKDVTKKINMLRTCYKRELKRMRDLQKTGAGAEDSFESTLYYFDAMKFLSAMDAPTYSRSNLQEDEEPKFKKKKISPAEELVLLASEQFTKKDTSTCSRLANVWGQQLNEMPHQQRLFAQKIVNDIMFNGAMGLLNFNTCLSNLNPVSMHESCSSTNFSNFPSASPSPTMHGRSSPVSITSDEASQHVPVNSESILAAFYETFSDSI